MKRKKKRRRSSTTAKSKKPAGRLALPFLRSGLLLTAGLPALLALVVFANTIGNGFVYDDRQTILRLSGEAPAAWHFLSHSRGVTYAFHWLDEAIWGASAQGFHLTNVLLHALASALVAWAALALTRNRRLALTCGSIFAVHPVHVEAVASFVNRKDILAMIFVALAVIAWRRTRHVALRFSLALPCYGLALLSKEVAAVGLAGMLFLADILALPGNSGSWRSRLRQAALSALPFLLGGLVFTIYFAPDLTRAFAPEAIVRTSEMRLESYEQVLANVAASVPENLRLLFGPLKLCADYASSSELTLFEPRPLVGMLLAGLWTLAAVLLARRAAVASFAMAWVIVMYLPCSNLVPLIHFFVAERYLYVPSFGVCLLLAVGFDRLFEVAKRKGLPWAEVVVPGLAILLLAAGGTRSALRNRDWRDDLFLWQSALEAGCETPRAHHNYAGALLRDGRRDEAVSHLRRALEEGPRGLAFRRRLIVLMMAAGMTGELGDECRRILAEHPEEWACHGYLGKISAGQGNPALAVLHFKAVLEQRPDSEEALKELTRLYATHPDAELGDVTEALELAERARMATGGNDPGVLHHLALLRAEAGEIDTAVAVAREAYVLAMSQGRTELGLAIQPTLRRLAYLQHRRPRWARPSPPPE